MGTELNVPAPCPPPRIMTARQKVCALKTATPETSPMALVILPDLPLPLAWAERIEKLVGPTLYRHPSGAPWIVGDPAGRALIHARHEALDVVLTGSVIALDEEALAAKVRRVKSIDALDSVAADYVEADTLLLARQPDRLRSQAPVFQTKSLFWTNLDDITVISDDQLPLGSIAGTGIDSAVLVSRLTDAELSFPFSINSIWRDVHSLGPGEWLDSYGGRPPKRRLWWRAPEPTLSVADLASPLRASIHHAIRDRVADRGVVSSDLSGGLDSTCLTFFISEMGLGHHTIFFSSENAANNDRAWALRAAGEVGSHHIVRPYSSVILSLLNDRVASVRTLPEGPGMASVAVASIGGIEDLLQDTGSTLHLNGHGGDALFGPVSTMLWSLLHSRDKHRFQKAWNHRVTNRYPGLHDGAW